MLRINAQSDFTDMQVRTLHGHLLDAVQHAQSALQKLEQLRMSNPRAAYNEAVELVSYELEQMGIQP